MKQPSHGRLPQLVEELQWFALLVPPQKEFAAAEMLHRRGIATFCPYDVVFRHKSAIAKRRGLPKEERKFPIMPRYVFAGFPGIPPWWHLFNLPHLAGVVGLNGTPLQIGSAERPVMSSFIGKFKNGLRRPDAERFMATHREYKAGDLATIVDSAWKGRVVEVEAIENGRAFFTIEVFNSEHRLSLPLDQLEAA
ncbi:MAG TPA: transcription termination/antitermination NusG family protein [Salinarimonas sp.]|nr:transcription termination/antitermination NusG family protein [Salinarimonas sp.]